jgi:hypothetical protein
MGWYADRTGDVGSYADTTATDREESSFATGGAAGGIFRIMGVFGLTPDLEF